MTTKHVFSSEPDLVPLTVLRSEKLLVSRQPGKSLSINTLYRWAMRGLRGGTIRLRTILYGGTRCTTRRWLAEFIDALNAAEPRSIDTPPRTAGQRTQDAKRAREGLEEAWKKSGKRNQRGEVDHV